MKFFPVITAILVSAFLYVLVFEREALMAFAAGGEQDGDYASDIEPAKDPVGVVALASQAQTIDSAVLVRGQTQASRQVLVRAETSGLVISEPLRAGAYIEADTLLCHLDEGTRASSLAEARARLAEAKANMPSAQARVPEARALLRGAQARLEEALINDRAASALKKDGFASTTRVAATTAAVEAALAAVETAEAGIQSAEGGIESALASVQSAEAAVATVERDISKLEIRAPFAGLLETDTAELGSLLQPGSECAIILQLDPIKLVGFVPETEVDKIAVGSVGAARLATGGTMQGRVSFLSRSADALTRTFRVEFEVPNPDYAIRDGQTVEMQIASDGAEAHLLPGSALTLNDEGALGVRVVDEAQTAQFRPVELVRDTREGVWVKGLDAAADVIVVGQEYVTDGVPVKVTYREAN
ncbi:efflux RND transporter periplasmic adaptor subunit [Algirhabdus cladophorae]|uniref:efflux RND transporter periplasmic adaptor subunit n=1 Tax=Algirhabdus cladophorae TaxID=3377108 RepID=UPI003B84A791